MKWAARPFTVLKVRMVSVCLETECMSYLMT